MFCACNIKQGGGAYTLVLCNQSIVEMLLVQLLADRFSVALLIYLTGRLAGVSHTHLLKEAMHLDYS